MSDQEKALSRYVEKMYQIQYQQQPQDEILTLEDLKKVAIDMGVTEDQWQASLDDFQSNLTNGEAGVKYGNWDSAVQALEEATAFNPYDLKALQTYSRALLGRFNDKGREEDVIKAKSMIDRSLMIAPGNAISQQLLNQISSGKEAVVTEKKQSKLALYLGSSVIVALLVLGIISVRNGVATEDENVKASWAQVENVYQRRADLIPSLVNTVKGAAKNEQDALDKLTRLQSEVMQMQVSTNVSQEQFNAFSQKQQALGQALQVVLNNAGRSQQLQATQAFRDLMMQLEGSENRIATERRKFNKAVQTYNTKVRQFPYSFMGYNAKPYFQADKGAMEKPDVSF